nr:peptidoglycan-binding protein [Pseudomonadota bacterium]
VYARGAELDQRHYQVFQLGEPYRDPASGEVLGLAALFAADAVLEAGGDPATLRLTASRREALIGDRLFPADDQPFAYEFIPHAPPPGTRGQIIAVIGGVSLVGQYQTVVVNLGRRQLIEPGHVLEIFNAGRLVRDPVRRETVELPPERAGLLMIYKVYDRVSYALIMSATRAIRILDRVATP